jgi:tetraacyldisaccharide 4'-kinase
VTRSTILRTLLQPLGLLYALAMRVRANLYQSGLLRNRRLPGIVISVGNLTVGGTGKTPMVLWIAERLSAEGHRPAILTRGYGGFWRGSSATGQSDADEVALLRQRLNGRARFGIGKNRYKNGLALAKDGAEWFILDDGLQHLELHRDADIILLDSTNPFGGGLLPAGRSREPRSALARADVVVITRNDCAPALETLVRRFTNAPIFYAQAQLSAVVPLATPAATLSQPERRQLKVFAFCGIGNPAAFFDDLRHWGFTLVGSRSFADHHRCSAEELRDLIRAASAAGANCLVCTEKDRFNLPDLAATALPIYVCAIRMALNDEAGFWLAVQASIGRKQPVTQA